MNKPVKTKSCRNCNCSCGCNGYIKLGDEFVIYAGYFFKPDHFDIEKADHIIFGYICEKTFADVKQLKLDLF